LAIGICESPDGRGAPYVEASSVTGAPAGAEVVMIHSRAGDRGPAGVASRRDQADTDRRPDHVRDVLAEARFDKREAARMLEISLASLYRKLGEA
jgi:DNA-binding NtrC family response regulator